MDYYFSFLIIVNMYIAVILENYSQATEDVQEGKPYYTSIVQGLFFTNIYQV